MFGDELIYGEKFSIVDSKNRFNLPKFTCCECGDLIIALIDSNLDFMNFYTPQFINEVLNDESISEEIKKNFQLAELQKVKPDKQKRIIIPKAFLSTLKDNVIFVRGRADFVSCFKDKESFKQHVLSHDSEYLRYL